MRQVWWNGFVSVIRKDFTREFRSGEVVATTVSFSLLVVLVFSFSFLGDTNSAVRIFPGILWAGVLFATTLTINQTFGYERRNQCLQVLKLLPGGPRALFYGKVVVNLALMLVFELVLFPALLVVFGLWGSSRFFLHCALLAGVSAGLAILGTLVAAVLSEHRLREVLMPLLLFPLGVPFLISGLYGSGILLGTRSGAIADWFAAIAGMDVLFLLIGHYLFGKGL